jgi:hypothetical protein
LFAAFEPNDLWNKECINSKKYYFNIQMKNSTREGRGSHCSSSSISGRSLRFIYQGSFLRSRSSNNLFVYKKKLGKNVINGDESTTKCPFFAFHRLFPLNKTYTHSRISKSIINGMSRNISIYYKTNFFLMHYMELLKHYF